MLKSSLTTIDTGRRRFLAGLSMIALAIPFFKAVRVNAADYVEYDGWILRRDDLEDGR